MKQEDRGAPRPSLRTRRAAAMFAALGVAGLGLAALAFSRPGTAHMSQAEKIALGERITYIAACNDCHTPGTFYGNADAKRRLSGSELGWEGPWGVSYPRNLTPDVETGLGSWSEEDIVRAIRTGQRPDKTPLLPPMPWPMYAHMTDEEAYAVAAYLKSLPPVKHRVPDRIAPGAPTSGPAMRFPAPPAWDVAHMTATIADVSATP